MVPLSEVEPEIKGLVGTCQPLIHYGPPPAIKILRKNTGYDADFHPFDLIEHLRNGHSRSEIVAAWGITYSAFNEWLDSYSELGEALAIGIPAYEAYYKQALRKSAFGQLKKVRENSLFFMLKNQAGFDEHGGGHEFNEGSKASLEFDTE